MPAHSHPPRESDAWDNPDFCPFCGAELADAGQGFIDHIDAMPTCKERFEAWREQVRSDVGSEWSG